MKEKKREVRVDRVTDSTGPHPFPRSFPGHSIRVVSTGIYSERVLYVYCIYKVLFKKKHHQEKRRKVWKKEKMKKTAAMAVVL